MIACRLTENETTTFCYNCNKESSREFYATLRSMNRWGTAGPAGVQAESIPGKSARAARIFQRRRSCSRRRASAASKQRRAELFTGPRSRCCGCVVSNSGLSTRAWFLHSEETLCAAMNPLFATSEIQSFLDSFPYKSRRRGKQYFAGGAVIDAACVEPDREFAAVVCDGQEFEVTLDYDAKTRSWFAECTCPLMFDCKHAYAAMLALQADAPRLSSPAKPARDKSGAGPKAKSASKRAAAPAREEPQPPPSPLSTALTQALGRKLNRVEADYVRRIQWFHHEARCGRTMNADVLRQLAPELKDYSWTPLELWPEFPRN